MKKIEIGEAPRLQQEGSSDVARMSACSIFSVATGLLQLLCGNGALGLRPITLRDPSQPIMLRGQVVC